MIFKETYEDDIPQWHINTVKQRLEDYRNDISQAVDFDLAIEDIIKFFEE